MCFVQCQTVKCETRLLDGTHQRMELYHHLLDKCWVVAELQQQNARQQRYRKGCGGSLILWIFKIASYTVNGHNWPRYLNFHWVTSHTLSFEKCRVNPSDTQIVDIRVKTSFFCNSHWRQVISQVWFLLYFTNRASKYSNAQFGSFTGGPFLLCNENQLRTTDHIPKCTAWVAQQFEGGTFVLHFNLFVKNI